MSAQSNQILLKASDRGQADYGWLKARYSFSFSEYFNPHWMSFNKLRVLNHDIIAPNGGFPTHSHQNMEIITFVMRGELEHKDGLGNQAIIRPGEIQIMSAGDGISHSEFNPSSTEECELHQIWILPSTQGGKPSYGQVSYQHLADQNVIKLIGAGGLVSIKQAMALYLVHLSKIQTQKLSFDSLQDIWIQVTKGSAVVNGTILEKSDGLGLYQIDELSFEANAKFEALVFCFS
jgi:redox-sensitive bicupin YhaK (pirin superfamily)